MRDMSFTDYLAYEFKWKEQRRRTMDTQRDIEIDRWYQEYEGCCGTCHYYTKEDNGKHSCMCMDSPFAADWVEPEDGCSRYVLTRKVR